MSPRLSPSPARKAKTNSHTARIPVGWSIKRLTAALWDEGLALANHDRHGGDRLSSRPRHRGARALPHPVAPAQDDEDGLRRPPSRLGADAGYKALSTDGGVAVVRRGAAETAFFAFMGDEHAAPIAPGIGETLAPGDPVTLTVPHCDPTVNLYDHYQRPWSRSGRSAQGAGRGDMKGLSATGRGDMHSTATILPFRPDTL